MDSIEDKIRSIVSQYNLSLYHHNGLCKYLTKLFKDEIATREISYQQLQECFVGRGDELKEKDEQIKELKEALIEKLQK